MVLHPAATLGGLTRDATEVDLYALRCRARRSYTSSGLPRLRPPEWPSGARILPSQQGAGSLTRTPACPTTSNRYSRTMKWMFRKTQPRSGRRRKGPENHVHGMHVGGHMEMGLHLAPEGAGLRPACPVMQRMLHASPSRLDGRRVTTCRNRQPLDTQAQVRDRHFRR